MTDSTYFERNGERYIRTIIETKLSDLGLPFPIPPIVAEPPPPTGKLLTPHSVVNGAVKILGAGLDNLLIYVNDFVRDTPEVPLLWLMADKGKVNIAAWVLDHNTDPNFTNAQIQKYFADDRNWAVAQGLKNVPPAVQGSTRKLAKPSNGNIDSTIPADAPGVDEIIKAAHRCTPEKPLMAIVGGQCTSVASAYLKDKTIAPKMIVFHTAGWVDGKTGSYNLGDPWSAYICMKRMKYVVPNIQTDGNPYWWTGKNMGLTSTMVNSIPDGHPAVKIFKRWYTEAFAREGMADAGPVLWWLDNSLWKSVQRRKEDGTTTPNEDYDYLFIPTHDWPKYGPTLVNKIKELLGVEPPVVIPPVVTPPIGGIERDIEVTIERAAPGNTVRLASGKTFTLRNTNVPVGVSVDLGGSIILASTPGGWNEQKAVFKIENGRDQTIKNGTINCKNIGAGATLVINSERVHIDLVDVFDTKFFAHWTQGSKNGSVKNCKTKNASWATIGWASGDIAFMDISDYLFENIHTSSDSPNRGYGLKAMYDKRSLTNVTFRKITTRMHQESNWNNKQSYNIGLELADSKLLGTTLIENCDFGNQMSFSCKEPNPGNVIIRNSLFKSANDRYCIEGIVNNLEVYGCTFENAMQWIFNGKRNFKVNNWKIHDNTYNQGTAPNTGWGAVILFGGEGASNIDVRKNTIRKKSANELVKYQGTQGGVNADINSANTIVNF